MLLVILWKMLAVTKRRTVLHKNQIMEILMIQFTMILVYFQLCFTLHKAIFINKRFSQFGVELNWPAQCVDLNPTQHLWNELEWNISSLQTSQILLWLNESIPAARFQNLSKSWVFTVPAEWRLLQQLINLQCSTITYGCKVHCPHSFS